MLTSSFLTRIESYRDPKALWPLAAIASVVAHGVVLVALRPWVITLQPQPEPEDAPIPIQLLAEAPTDTQSTPQAESPTAPQADTPAEAPTDAPSSTPPTITPSVTAPPADLAPPTPAPPTPDLPTLTPPVPQPTNPQPTIPQPTIPQPTNPQLPNPQPTIPPTPNPQPPTDSPTGQLSPLGIQAAPFGRDFPDVPPRLTSNASLTVQPWLSVCGISNLGAIASPGTVAMVTLQLQVEASGEVSYARVIESSGSAAIDNLVSCMVRGQLRLEPAQVAGQPFVTDAYLLQTQVQF